MEHLSLKQCPYCQLHYLPQRLHECPHFERPTNSLYSLLCAPKIRRSEILETAAKQSKVLREVLFNGTEISSSSAAPASPQSHSPATPTVPSSPSQSTSQSPSSPSQPSPPPPSPPHHHCPYCGEEYWPDRAMHYCSHVEEESTSDSSGSTSPELPYDELEDFEDAEEPAEQDGELIREANESSNGSAQISGQQQQSPKRAEPSVRQCPYCKLHFNAKVLHYCTHTEEDVPSVELLPTPTLVPQCLPRSAMSQFKRFYIEKSQNSSANSNSERGDLLRRCPYCKCHYWADKLHQCEHVETITKYLPPLVEKYLDSKQTKKQRHPLAIKSTKLAPGSTSATFDQPNEERNKPASDSFPSPESLPLSLPVAPSTPTTESVAALPQAHPTQPEALQLQSPQPTSNPASINPNLASIAFTPTIHYINPGPQLQNSQQSYISVDRNNNATLGAQLNCLSVQPASVISQQPAFQTVFLPPPQPALLAGQTVFVPQRTITFAPSVAPFMAPIRALTNGFGQMVYHFEPVQQPHHHLSYNLVESGSKILDKQVNCSTEATQVNSDDNHSVERECNDDDSPSPQASLAPSSPAIEIEKLPPTPAPIDLTMKSVAAPIEFVEQVNNIEPCQQQQNHELITESTELLVNEEHEEVLVSKKPKIRSKLKGQKELRKQMQKKKKEFKKQDKQNKRKKPINHQKIKRQKETKKLIVLKTPEKIKKPKLPLQKISPQSISTRNKPTQNKPTQNKPTQNRPTQNKPTQNRPTQNMPTLPPPPVPDKKPPPFRPNFTPKQIKIIAQMEQLRSPPLPPPPPPSLDHPFKCPVCAGTFGPTVQELIGHLRASHLETCTQGDSYRLSRHCTLCPRTLATLQQLIVHIEMVHGSGIWLPANDSPKKVGCHASGDDLLPPPSFQCTQCSRLFYRSCDLVRHRRKLCHHPKANGELDDHSTEGHLYCCEQCGKRYPSWHDLKWHCCLQLKRRLLSCDACMRLFAEEADLKVHLEKHVTHQIQKRKGETLG